MKTREQQPQTAAIEVGGNRDLILTLEGAPTPTLRKVSRLSNKGADMQMILEGENKHR